MNALLSTVVVIALFFISSSQALKCYDSNNRESACSDGVQYCTKLIAGNIISKGCDGTGTVLSPNKCAAQGNKCLVDSQSANFCCCQGDLCNSATTTAIGAATLVASIVAVVAARFF